MATKMTAEVVVREKGVHPRVFACAAAMIAALLLACAVQVPGVYADDAAGAASAPESAPEFGTAADPTAGVPAEPNPVQDPQSAPAPDQAEAAPQDAPADGWYFSDGATYFYENGVAVAGQRQIDGFWYFFDPAAHGAMATGFVSHESQGKTVYYDHDGRMLYGEQVIDGTRYWFDEVTGAMTGSLELAVVEDPSGLWNPAVDEYGHVSTSVLAFDIPQAWLGQVELYVRPYADGSGATLSVCPTGLVSPSGEPYSLMRLSYSLGSIERAWGAWGDGMTQKLAIIPVDGGVVEVWASDFANIYADYMYNGLSNELNAAVDAYGWGRIIELASAGTLSASAIELGQPTAIYADGLDSELGARMLAETISVVPEARPVGLLSGGAGDATAFRYWETDDHSQAIAPRYATGGTDALLCTWSDDGTFAFSAYNSDTQQITTVHGVFTEVWDEALCGYEVALWTDDGLEVRPDVTSASGWSAYNAGELAYNL